MLDGEEVIVHRKGATPAGKNVLGIIPGSMSANGFIVKAEVRLMLFILRRMGPAEN